MWEEYVYWDNLINNAGNCSVGCTSYISNQRHLYINVKYDGEPNLNLTHYEKVLYISSTTNKSLKLTASIMYRFVLGFLLNCLIGFQRETSLKKI